VANFEFSFCCGGSCNDAISNHHYTPDYSATIVHLYDMAQLCSIPLIMGTGSSNFGLSSSLSHRHFFLLLCHLPFPYIDGLLVGHGLPYLLADVTRLADAEHCSVSTASSPDLSSFRLQSASLSHHSDGLGVLATLSAKCNIIPITFPAGLPTAAEQWPMFRYTSNYMVSCSPDRSILVQSSHFGWGLLHLGLMWPHPY